MNAPRRYLPLLVAGALVFAVALTGCASQPANTVSIHDLKFDPPSITVAKGTTVTWINNDEAAHTITTDDLGAAGVSQAGQFTSQPLNPGEKFTHTFDTTGEFKYHCTIHPFIKGAVTVK
jgi:plastocyanin